MEAFDVRDQVVQAIASAIHLDPANVELEASFDALGFDSLSKVGIVPELERIFGCMLDPQVLFDYPNVQSLSEHIEVLTRPTQRVALGAP